MKTKNINECPDIVIGLDLMRALSVSISCQQRLLFLTLVVVRVFVYLLFFCSVTNKL